MCAAHPRIVLGLHRSRHQRRLLTGAADLGVNAIDTSSNYFGFRSHETLANTASDLLSRFTLSTKVGYFPTADAAEHSLDADRLRTAVEHAARDLGREPDLVFLHNPEHSLARTTQSSARDWLAGGCSVLAEAAAHGLCGAWGISSWDPRPLAALGRSDIPRPDVLMVRAGLLVGAEVLDAADHLVEQWQPLAVWGMSPFGGNTTESVWRRFDPRTFLCDPQRATPTQAAFRTAFHLPATEAVAVGTDDLDHLRELSASLLSQVDEEAIRRYRHILRNRRQRD